MYDLQSINNQLCFVVNRESGALVWFSERQSWWTVEAAQKRFQSARHRAADIAGARGAFACAAGKQFVNAKSGIAKEEAAWTPGVTRQGETTKAV